MKTVVFSSAFIAASILLGAVHNANSVSSRYVDVAIVTAAADVAHYEVYSLDKVRVALEESREQMMHDLRAGVDSQLFEIASPTTLVDAS